VELTTIFPRTLEGPPTRRSTRQQICAAIAKNRLFKDVRCAVHGIKKDSNFDEQIDLLVRLGHLLIVGEVKFWLFPAESFERFLYLRKLKDAARQAVRKADALRRRPEVAATALGLTDDECRRLRVVPLVVANQGFGFSLNIDGCFVTDALFLRNYLGGGNLSTTAAVVPTTGRFVPFSTTLYENEAQVAGRFEAALASPYVLQRFIDRISWTVVPFPAPSGIIVDLAAARLGDLIGEERHHAETAVEIFRPVA
jgi:hypothetical protein